jgi:hypothetical protein
MSRSLHKYDVKLLRTLELDAAGHIGSIAFARFVDALGAPVRLVLVNHAALKFSRRSS